MNKVENVELTNIIKITFITGIGTKEDPVRQVIQYWNLEKELLFELDNYEFTNCSASSEINS